MGQHVIGILELSGETGDAVQPMVVGDGKRLQLGHGGRGDHSIIRAAFRESLSPCHHRLHRADHMAGKPHERE